MAAPDFDLNVESDADGRRRVTVRGELDLATAEPLERALEIRDGDTRILVDLRGLTFMDSTGVRTLLQITQDAEQAGAEVRFLLPGDGGARLTMTETGIDALLPVAEEPSA